jgi:hypothetical protein
MLRSACGTHRLLLDELTANDDEPPRFDEAPFRSMKYGRGVFTRPYEETPLWSLRGPSRFRAFSRKELARRVVFRFYDRSHATKKPPGA